MSVSIINQSMNHVIYPLRDKCMVIDVTINKVAVCFSLVFPRVTRAVV